MVGSGPAHRTRDAGFVTSDFRENAPEPFCVGECRAFGSSTCLLYAVQWLDGTVARSVEGAPGHLPSSGAGGARRRRVRGRLRAACPRRRAHRSSSCAAKQERRRRAWRLRQRPARSCGRRGRWEWTCGIAQQDVRRRRVRPREVWRQAEWRVEQALDWAELNWHQLFPGGESEGLRAP